MHSFTSNSLTHEGKLKPFFEFQIGTIENGPLDDFFGISYFTLLVLLVENFGGQPIFLFNFSQLECQFFKLIQRIAVCHRLRQLLAEGFGSWEVRLGIYKFRHGVSLYYGPNYIMGHGRRFGGRSCVERSA